MPTAARLGEIKTGAEDFILIAHDGGSVSGAWLFMLPIGIGNEWKLEPGGRQGFNPSTPSTVGVVS